MALNRRKVSQAADKFARLGQLKEAVMEYQRLLEECPDDVGLLNKVGDLHNRIGQTEKALACFNRIATHYRDRGFTQKAIAIFKKIAKLDPNGTESREQLASLYADQGLIREAQENLREAARICAKKSDSERALELESRALELRPDDSAGQRALAQRLHQAGEAERSIATFLRAAEGYVRAAEVETALACLREAIGVAPLDPAPAVALCRLLVEAQRAPDAVAEMERLLKRDPGTPHLLALMGEALLENGEVHRAREALTGARGDATAESDVNFLAACIKLDLREGRVEDAMPMVDRALAVLASQGDEDRALRLLREALAAAPGVEHLLDGLQRLTLRADPRRPETEAALDLLVGLLPQAGREEMLPMVLRRLIRSRPDDAAIRQQLVALGGDPAEGGEAQRAASTATAGSIPLAVDEGEGDVDHDFISEHLTEADVFIKYKLLAKAAAYLRRITDRYPLTIVAHQRLVDLYMEMGNRPAAVFQSVALAEACQQRGAVAEAEKAIADALAYAPEDAHLKAARQALAAGEPLTLPELPATEKEASPAVQKQPPAVAASPPPPQLVAMEIDEEIIDLDEPVPRQPAHLHSEVALPIELNAEAPGLDAADGGDLFDLAGAIEDELTAESNAQQDLPVMDDRVPEEARSGISRAIQDQVGADDYQTHYQLGIAFKEMGMLDQAIGEFQQSSHSPEGFLACCSMLGLCFREKGMPQIAEKWYQRGLQRAAAAATEPEQRLGLVYDLGELMMEGGDLSRALECFTEVYSFDANYREVTARVDSLRNPDKMDSEERP